MEEITELDKAAEAREARRRRILEKSNARLTKITGREHNEGKLDLFWFLQMTIKLFGDLSEIAEPIVNSGVYPDPEMERDVYEAPITFAGIDHETQDIFELLKTMQGGQQFSQSTQPMTPPVPETALSKFIRSKFPIILIALIVYMLFAVNLDFAVGGAVFSSFIVWEIFEFFLTTFILREQPKQGGLVNLLFVFSGVSPEKSQLILKLIGLANKIIKDMAIFMFTFVMIHLLWSYLVVGESLTEILDKDFSNLLKNDEL